MLGSLVVPFSQLWSAAPEATPQALEATQVAAAAAPSLGEILSPWSVVPFVLMLLSIAVLPLVAPMWWHHNRNRALVAFVLGAPMAMWMGYLDWHVLAHTAHEYVAFIILLGSLFVISGGIVIRGTLSGSPIVNTTIIMIGTALASVIGTTGASMLLIRPLLRANAQRQHRVHIFVFFIFLVSNIGGLLTPLGDPPLFLGFLRGVPFSWTFQLAPMWAMLSGLGLVLFYALDRYYYGKEPHPQQPATADGKPPVNLSIDGKVNFIFFVGVVLVIYFSGKYHLPGGAQELSMVTLAMLSLMVTPKVLHRQNDFSWAPITEVVVVFAGIFATMIPALALLNEHGANLGISQPWQFFWATGLLSSFLDNAPTYLTFTAIASGLQGTDAAALQELIATSEGHRLLVGISLGAVFMGANTYIGNGPNFMVKAVAESGGVRMPTFFGYLGYSVLFLFPMFGLVTAFFL